MMKISQTAENAILALGGEKIWKESRFIEAIVSVKGLAFILKGRPFYDKAFIRMEIEHPNSEITPIGAAPGITGVLKNEDVYLRNTKGEVIAERKKARTFFPGGKRLFRWDDLDMAYFANYAFWNYFTLPRLLLREDIVWMEKKQGLLTAFFPNEIPTHNKVQQFKFDANSGLLLQHNYTASVISKFARAAHVIKEYKEFNGILVPSKRVVTPAGIFGNPMKGPVLIDIEIHDFSIKC